MSCLSTPVAPWAKMAMGSSATANPINIAPRARSPTLEDALANSAVRCHCGTDSSAPQQFPDQRVGRIMQLPDILGSLPRSSVRHQQPKLNDNAGNHPCIISSVSACGHLAFCTQLTSFHGRGIEHKYAYCRDPVAKQRIFDGYMPLEEPNTRPINDRGMLSYDGQMNKQSYAQLEFGYWMEFQYLEIKVDAALHPNSLDRLRSHYATAERYRLVHGSAAEAAFAKKRGRPSSPASPARTQPWRRQSPSPAGPPPFVLPRRCNAALTIKRPASQEQPWATSNNWRPVKAA